MNGNSDFLVIGSGIAGFWFALKTASHGRVILVTKKKESDSNTNYAQGGIASVLAKDDSFDLHIEDTLRGGAGLCHRDAVELMVRSGPQAIRELMETGVRFSNQSNGLPDLRREGGHSRRRIVHAEDLTGAEIENALVNAAKAHPNITVFEDRLALELAVEQGEGEPRSGRHPCRGVWALNRCTGEIEQYEAAVTLLAAGGCGKIYLYTSNPDVATGDGVAMAYRAGAQVANLEFVQFHPTCLYHAEAKSFLISEVVRGEGAVLRTLDGATFMERYHPEGGLAPRDVVARAIDQEIKQRGEKHVWLDLAPVGSPEVIRSRFPHIYRGCLKYGIDISRDLVPVVPAAHYMCGGVVSDLHGRTNIPGLYVAGEVACTGVHGANRLASNSLLEAVVFAARAAEAAGAELCRTRVATEKIPEWVEGGNTPMPESVVLDHDWDSVRTLMWDYVGIVRRDERLELAESRLRLLSRHIEGYYRRFRVAPDLVELRNIVTVGLLIVRCALTRKESRGLHCNLDYTERDDVHWQHDTVLQKPATPHYGSQSVGGENP
ncbi:MAG: L-aspartate oxidase [Candidatus Eisenbacteria sp.]|nr:L-aspartate oxidase [Candidatus Eisenbacteria bacterium]